MSFSKILELIIIGLYSAGSLTFPVGVFTRKGGIEAAATLLALTGFALHALDLVLMMSAPAGAALHDGPFYFSLFSWILLLIYFVLRWRLKVQFLALVATPLTLIFYTWSLVLSGVKVQMPGFLKGLFLGLHIGAFFLSLSLLAMASAAGALYLVIEKKIKNKSGFGGFLKNMPPLSAFDQVNHWAVMAGFPLFTLGVLSGFVWAGITWGRVFSGDPKEVATLIIWLLFAFLFHQRLALGWRGRKTATMAIWVFAFSLVSLLGINFLLPTHHGFKP